MKSEKYLEELQKIVDEYKAHKARQEKLAERRADLLEQLDVISGDLSLTIDAAKSEKLRDQYREINKELEDIRLMSLLDVRKPLKEKLSNLSIEEHAAAQEHAVYKADVTEKIKKINEDARKAAQELIRSERNHAYKKARGLKNSLLSLLAKG